MKFKKYDQAKQYAQEAQKVSQESHVPYVALAHIAEAQREKTKAQQYWQQAIDKLNPNIVGYELMLRDYKTSLEALK